MSGTLTLVFISQTRPLCQSRNRWAVKIDSVCHSDVICEFADSQKPNKQTSLNEG